MLVLEPVFDTAMYAVSDNPTVISLIPTILECSEPHVEAAVVYAVRPTSLLVFVPKFHLKGSVHLIDRAGLVRLPVTAPGQDTDDAFSISQRRQHRLDSGLPGHLEAWTVSTHRNVNCITMTISPRCQVWHVRVVPQQSPQSLFCLDPCP